MGTDSEKGIQTVILACDDDDPLQLQPPLYPIRQEQHSRTATAAER